MRRALTASLVVALTIGLWTTSASAGLGGIKLGRDPDDATSILDIRTVGTDVSGRRVFTGVRTWDNFAPGDVLQQNQSGFIFKLDTRDRGRYDRVTYLAYDNNDGRFECRVFTRGGGFKGERRANASNEDISCVTPRRWYDIQKEVKFGVESYELNFLEDRAPNNGRYRGL